MFTYWLRGKYKKILNYTNLPPSSLAPDTSGTLKFAAWQFVKKLCKCYKLDTPEFFMHSLSNGKQQRELSWSRKIPDLFKLYDNLTLFLLLVFPFSLCHMHSNNVWTNRTNKFCVKTCVLQSKMSVCSFNSSICKAFIKPKRKTLMVTS